jgi:hypothetical protein
MSLWREKPFKKMAFATTADKIKSWAGRMIKLRCDNETASRKIPENSAE